ncbi:hypothetical protein KEM52_005485 [Ascosphaera acerosa]|nr:hypothetical protein KEM52_005485 [Ascosphaera acerosa]
MPQAIEPFPAAPSLDGVAYLYGHPLLNSLSPLLHKTIYDALNLHWEQFPLSKSDTASQQYPPPYTLSPPLEQFIGHVRTNARFVGSSVTMPYKVAILPHLDQLTEEARGVGACNTIFLTREDGNHPDQAEGQSRRVLIGTNTDCIGIREALLRNLPSGMSGNPYAGKPGLIIGGGGTARAAIYAFRRWLGVSRIYIVNRDDSEIAAIVKEDADRRAACGGGTDVAPIVHVRTAEEVTALDPPVAIMSGIPDYPPVTEAETSVRETVKAFFSLAVSHAPHKPVVLEMCYHPHPWTAMAQLARGSGCHVVLGSEAMIWQGIEQARLWTGVDIASVPGVADKVEKVIKQAIEERQT